MKSSRAAALRALPATAASTFNPDDRTQMKQIRGSTPTSTIHLFPLLLALAAACGNGDEPAVDARADGVVIKPDLAPPVIVDLRADVNRDGKVDLTDPTEDANEETWSAKQGAIFLANLDDDDLSCPKVTNALSDAQLAACHDAADEALDGPKDILDLAPLATVPWPAAPDGAVGTIILSLPVSASADPYKYVRLFISEGGTYKVLARGAQLKAAQLRKGVKLALEGKDIVRDRRVWDGYLDVKLEVKFTDSGKPRTERDTVRMRVAPVLTNHHLQGTDTLYVSKLNDPDSLTFRSQLGSAVTKAGSAKFVEYSVFDQWTQDFFETGWMSMPAAGGKQHVIKVFLRSANVDAPKDPVAPLRAGGRIVFHARGPDVAAVQQYDLKHPGQMDTLNSLGNLETIPPYSNGGESYPMGRMIMGNVASFYPDKSFTLMLEAQAVQKPLWIDTSWLLVGHTDETISFVKAANKRGWMLVLNDPTMAKKMLEDASKAGHGAVTMFEGKYWLNNANQEVSAQTTIAKVLADTEVMSESAKAAVEVASQLAQLKKELGITEAEIIRIPFLHYALDGYSVAYQPGTVNSTLIGVANFAAPETHGPVIGGVDIFKKQLTDAFAKHKITVHYIENWDLYHRLLGEVHCGSNSLRSPWTSAKWWEAGR